MEMEWPSCESIQMSILLISLHGMFITAQQLIKHLRNSQIKLSIRRCVAFPLNIKCARQCERFTWETHKMSIYALEPLLQRQTIHLLPIRIVARWMLISSDVYTSLYCRCVYTNVDLIECRLLSSFHIEHTNKLRSSATSTANNDTQSPRHPNHHPRIAWASRRVDISSHTLQVGVIINQSCGSEPFLEFS